MIYLICFFVSVFFAYLASRAGNKATFITFSIVSIAVTVTLAGLRDYSIGVDTMNYLQMDLYWEGAVTARSLGEYLRNYFAGGGKEPLFALFMGVIAQTTGSYRAFLFLSQVFLIGCVYTGAYRLKEHADPVLTLLLFYLLYYNYTFNAIRQYMSLAVLFAATRDMEERRTLRYLIYVVIAALIHNTSILGAALPILFMMTNDTRRLKKVSLTRRLILCGLMVGAVYSFDPIARMLIRFGVLSSKYLVYLNSQSNASFLASRLFLLLEMCVLVVFIRPFRKNNKSADYYFFCSIAFLLLFQLSTAIRTGARIARFFSLPNITTLGMLGRCVKGNKRIVVTAGIVFVVLVYWLYTYAITNYSHTYPYRLGI